MSLEAVAEQAVDRAVVIICVGLQRLEGKARVVTPSRAVMKYILYCAGAAQLPPSTATDQQEEQAGHARPHLHRALLVQPHVRHGQQHVLVQRLQLPLGLQVLTLCYQL